MRAESAAQVPLWVRIGRLPLVRLIVLGGIMFFMMAVNGGFLETYRAQPLVAIAITVGMAAVALAIYIGWGRFVERRGIEDFALPGMGRELLTGLAAGAVLYSLCVLVLILLGLYRIEGLNPLSFVIPALGMALSAGIFKEMVFRGVLFRSVEDMAGSWISLVVSSLVFGLTHLINPAATLLGAIFISIEAGLLLAAAYMLTRRFWLAIGFHVAWNYVQSAIYSGIVSGSEAAPGLIRSNITGPDVLTGGSFGVESSVIAFAFCTATGVFVLVMAARRGRFVPPPWARRG